MSKKRKPEKRKTKRIRKEVMVDPGNMAIIEYLGAYSSDLVNKALDFYFRKKIRIAAEDRNKAYEAYMEKHYQLNLFSSKEEKERKV